MDKVLAEERLRDQKCPYCGVDKKELIYSHIENDGKEVFQVVDCIACEKHFTEVYSFCRVVLTDYPGEDFRVDFDDWNSFRSNKNGNRFKHTGEDGP